MTRFSNDFDQQRLDQSLTPTFLDQEQEYNPQGGVFHERLDVMEGHGRRAAGGRPTS
jgi:hypothetical protein